MSEHQTHDLAIRRVQEGDTVRVNFLAWSDEGRLVDSSLFGEPLVFTAGQGTVIRGLENLVIGMAVGESKTEGLSADLAFGPYRSDLTCQVDAAWFRDQRVVPAIGLCLEVRKADGTHVHMVVTDMEGNRVTLDANHWLAGKNLIVQVDLLGFVDASDADARPNAVSRQKA
jgi:peptidylprolyl isomerase